MSLFRVFLACLCLGLSSCGFESVYAVKNAAPPPGASIEIDGIPDREGQYLRNLLIDRLYTKGRPSGAAYRLTFSPLAKSVVDIGIQKDATATRTQMQIATQMRLVEKNTRKILLQRDLKTMGAYNLLDNQLATLVSQQNIIDSILQELGDDVVTELNLYFRRAGAGRR